jgi:hypothetical protein
MTDSLEAAQDLFPCVEYDSSDEFLPETHTTTTTRGSGRLR